MFLYDKKVAVSFETKRPLFPMLSLSVLKSHSTVAVRSIFKPKLIIVLKLLKMVNFTNAELIDRYGVIVGGSFIGNAVEARRLYSERYPNRRIPDSRAFTATVQRVRDHGIFDSQTPDLRRPRSDHVLEIEPEFLQTTEEEPNFEYQKSCFTCRCFHFYCPSHVT
jgi:hypothetical protein